MTEAEMKSNDVADPGREARRPSGLGRAIGILLRLIFVILLGVGIGAFAYFGVPAFYRGAVEPVQENTRRIVLLEAARERELEAALNRSNRLEEELAAVEGRLVERGQEIDELMALAQAQQEAIDAQQTRLQQLDSLEDAIRALDTDLNAAASQIEELQLAVFEADAPTQRLARQLHLLRAMELLTRSRLWIAQDNLGLATSDVEAARDGLAALRQASPEEEAEALTPILERLDLALEALPATPSLAAADLEVAWQLLLDSTMLEQEAAP